MITPRQYDIFWIVWKSEPVAISSIAEQLKSKISIPTLNRDLALLKKEKFLAIEGSGPATKYRITRDKLITAQLDLESYFKADIDDRKIITHFNHLIFEQLLTVQLFSPQDKKDLEQLNLEFQDKIKKTSPTIYKREFERLMIELSWKSSQIEGNTYDLLDTEQLLKYNIPSGEHSVEESTMLLNHKAAIEYIRDYAEDYREITPGKIIDIHSLIIQKLNIAKDFRKRLVRITGTSYTPPDNPFIIEEAVDELCRTVNKTKTVLEKAFLAILLLSYIQPFEDGNKRTARLLANAILMSDNRCPLSYRSVSPSDYKKAMLLFYEINNITAFRKIFLSQYRFAVENYF